MASKDASTKGRYGALFLYPKINNNMTTKIEPSIPASLKISSQLIATVAIILGGFWGIDQHYASAKDVEDLKQSLETQVRVLRQERTEDEISRLVAKKETQNGKLSPEETAQYAKLIRRSLLTDLEQKASDAKAEKAKK